MNINAFTDLLFEQAELSAGLWIGGRWERMHYGNEDAGMLAIYLKRLWEMLTVSLLLHPVILLIGHIKSNWGSICKRKRFIHLANGQLRYRVLIQ